MIRHYTTEPVDGAVIENLLESALRAPSPHNRQPWRFAVVRAAARIRLARAMGDQLRADLVADEAPTALIEQDIARSYQRITSAPVGILACLSMQEMDIYPDLKRNNAERLMAGQAVAA
ncbi:MAG TPA: nitroreductase family protein, partial [Anaerolineae bacterium]